MPHGSAALHGVMEGNGAYNKYARLPANGAALALAMPLLEQAVSRLPIEPDDRPLVIADYGSSQGQNSLAPMQVAIRKVRLQVGPNHPIMVFHIRPGVQ